MCGMRSGQTLIYIYISYRMYRIGCNNVWLWIFVRPLRSTILIGTCILITSNVYWLLESTESNEIQQNDCFAPKTSHNIELNFFFGFWLNLRLAHIVMVGVTDKLNWINRHSFCFCYSFGSSHFILCLGLQLN